MTENAGIDPTGVLVSLKNSEACSNDRGQQHAVAKGLFDRLACRLQSIFRRRFCRLGSRRRRRRCMFASCFVSAENTYREP